ncbi:hypothetical protein P167DRAFT_549156 [Morchella conica CCBAS932]|uniref:Uncharacterized protein n=1 Tax=Morchella conica CCBAS932 TaxID=1392247 RepID=A0A3N4KCC8_9PEZI|nr:hypothetical protein P167DRAFT_549156 [Morchella conica CCBAS932]
MARPFSRIEEDQESGAGNHVLGNESVQDGGLVAGNGIGNGVGTGIQAGVRSWWSNSRGETRGNSNEGIPKPSSQGNEMVTVSSNFAGLSPVITSGLYDAPVIASPISPRTGPSLVTFAPNSQPNLLNSRPLERPQPTVIRRSIFMPGNTAIQEAVQESQAPIDVETQQPPAGEVGKWWRRGSLKGLQSKLITVLVAGGFLAITLAIYLGLALTNDLRLRHEWHVLLILIILIATMFFCHALVRLCILATNPARLQRRPSRNFSRIPSVSGPDGYANPQEPIRIQTAFDQDVDGVEPDLTKLPPPVYGLWRCSVRVNPNQFYWVRRTSMQQSTIPEGREPISPGSHNTPRPPSYVSEDGVSYALAVENALSPARPEPPLPPHPSEVQWLQNRW